MLSASTLVVLAGLAAAGAIDSADPYARPAPIPRAAPTCSPVLAPSQPGLTCKVAGKLTSPVILANFPGKRKSPAASCAANCLSHSQCLAFAYDADTDVCTTYTEAIASMTLVGRKGATHSFWDRACYTCASGSPTSGLTTSYTSSSTTSYITSSTTSYLSSSTTSYLTSSTTSYLSSTVGSAPACTATQPVQDPSFESGLGPWTTYGTQNVTTPQDSCNAYSGKQVMSVEFSYAANDPAIYQEGGNVVNVMQSVTVCPNQPYTVQGFFKAAQLVNLECYATLCALWAANDGDTPGGYCSDGTALTTDYMAISGTYPANPNADVLTGAEISIDVGCEPNDPSQASSGFIYLDDIVLINQAFPAVVALPVPNPTPTTACSSISVTTPSVTTSSATTPSDTTSPCTCPPGVNEYALQSAIQASTQILGDVQSLQGYCQSFIQGYQEQISDAENAITTYQNEYDSDTFGAVVGIAEQHTIIEMAQQAIGNLEVMLSIAQDGVSQATNLESLLYQI